MEATEGWGILSFVALLLVLFVVSDIFVTWILQKILEPGVCWFQRVFFGIDKVRAGSEALIGRTAAAIEFRRAEDGQYFGSVLVEGETWQARSECQVPKGTPVRVVSRERLTLLVERIKAS